MKGWKRIGVGLLLAVVAGLGAFAFPQPMFAYTFEHRNYEIWSDRPIDPAITQVLDDATRRLETSRFYDPNKPIRLFFCNEGWRMRLYTGAVGGVADTLLTRNIYLRQADIPGNRIIPPHGRLADAAERPLSYFIAHEATHIMQSRAFGRLLNLRYPTWLIKGHADSVAKAGDFDFDENRRLLKQADRRLDYEKSGLYRRYHLMVALLVDKRDRPIRGLFADPPAKEDVVQELLR
jgi:hypothetical protein